MTRSPRLSSPRFVQIFAFVIIYTLLISLCLSFNNRNVQATRRGESEDSSNTANLTPGPSPSPEPSASPEPEPSPTPEPAPTMTPTAAPSPTQSIPTMDMPNLDGLRYEQPEEPEVPEEVPSTRCSPGQPDCNPNTGNPDPPRQAFRSRRVFPARRSLPLSQGQMLAWNSNPFTTPFFKYDASREGADASRRNDASFSLFEPVTGGSYDDFVMARLDPDNRTGTGGEDFLSRNFNWSLPLVGMAGRAGLSLGLSLSYNSLVWTRADDYVTYDADNGYPTPGFRLGFPAVYGQHYNSQTRTYGYLMLMPSGSRVELRQIGSTNTYEAADSSYLHLVDNGDGTLLMRTTDGTQLSYDFTDNGFRCSQVKDRNGNYLSIANSAKGRIESVTDTLGRVFNFNYDANNNLESISQTRGTSQYTWATFGYTNLTLQTNFTGLTIVGLPNGSTLPVLTQVGLPDGTYYKFSYNSWGQVYKITNYAADSNPNSDNHPLNYVIYNLPLTSSTAQTDCPRFTQSKITAENWMSGTEVVTNYATPTLTDCDGITNGCKVSAITLPDGTIHKEFTRSSGWQKGLPVLSETWANNEAQPPVSIKQRWSTTLWTQDNTGVSFMFNPRVTETNVYDPSGNRKRTTVNYSSFTLSCGTGCDLDYYLPFETKEYAANATDVLRTTQTDYNHDFDYTSRRIFGMASQKRVYDSSNGNALVSKADYIYDESGEFLVQQGTPIQHDAANYGAGFIYRGNLTKVKRWNVLNTSQSQESRVGYNTTGSPIFARDPLDHQVSISYADAFSDMGNMNTNALPTTTTDPAGNQSTSLYSYNVGVVTRKQGPPTNVASPAASTGAYVSYSYDTVGRLYQVTNSFNSASTTYLYPSSSNVVQTYSTIQDGLPPTVSAKLFDGAGRVRATAGEHPGSTGGYVGEIIVYDEMGRVKAASNPTEIYGSWQPTGDDVGPWVYSFQTYDWKGRPRVSTNQDGSTKETTYGGCGCAGGEVVTMRDEVNRYSKVYHDVLGRVSKLEELNWDQSVYRTTTTTLNALDQPMRVRQFQGSFTSPRFQDTTLTYDGYARLKTKRRPENSSETSTTFDYYADDTLQKITDARGATTNYAYNNRHLVTGINYGVPSGSSIAVPPTITYTYDAVGNRTEMTDGFGNQTYQYDQLSRLTSETRSIEEIDKSYTFDYGYNLGGELTSISNPADTSRNLSYVYNQAGRLTAVNGNQSMAYANVTNYASNLQYRASGALKHLTYGTGSGKNLDNQFNSRMQISRFEVNTMLGSNYQYYADGRIKFIDDISMESPASDKFDRSYVYDHVGRLTEAKSGTEAHTPSVTTDDRPYRQTFAFDEWNNLTARTGRVWTNDMPPVSTEYTDNRRQGWTYDADGRPIDQGLLETTYDASGRRITSHNMQRRWHGDVGLIVTQSFDGNGLRVKQKENNLQPTYLIRSTALGGQAVYEIGHEGNQWKIKTGFVNTGSETLAVQNLDDTGNPQVEWLYNNPVTGSKRGTVTTELDPMGLDAGLFAPPEGEPPTGGSDAPDLIFPRFGDIMNGDTGCTLNGFMVSCDMAMEQVSNESAEIERIWDWGGPGGAADYVSAIFNIRAHQEEWYSTPDDTPPNSQETPVITETTVPLIPGTIDPGVTVSRWTAHYRTVVDATVSPLHHGQQNRDPNKGKRKLTLTQVQGVRDVLVKTLDENTKCKEFMSAFLAELGSVTGVTPYSTDIVAIFDKLAQLGHIYSNKNTGALAWGAGSAGSGSGYVIFDFGAISKFVSLFIPVTLHEITHAAPSSDSDGYSHAQMDQSAFNVLSANDPNLGAFDAKRRYFADYIDAHCSHGNE